MALRVLLVAVGRLKEDYLRSAEAEYVKRLRPYCKLDIVEVKNEAALLAAIPERAAVFVLDERGDLTSSAELAAALDEHQQFGGGAPVVFAIGGADGHSAEVRKRASRLLAFGRFTIAHRLVRLLVLEQLYRCFKIVRGEPYHRD